MEKWECPKKKIRISIKSHDMQPLHHILPAWLAQSVACLHLAFRSLQVPFPGLAHSFTCFSYWWKDEHWLLVTHIVQACLDKNVVSYWLCQHELSCSLWMLSKKSKRNKKTYNFSFNLLTYWHKYEQLCKCVKLSVFTRAEHAWGVQYKILFIWP